MLAVRYVNPRHLIYSPTTKSYDKILRADHWAQISALIRSQIKLLDVYQAYNPENDGEYDGYPSGSATDDGGTENNLDHVDEGANVDVALPSSDTLTSLFSIPLPSNDHFILGSYLGIRTIGKLVEKSKGDIAFTSFPARVSVTIKKLNPADAVVIDETSEVRDCHELIPAQSCTNYRCLGWRIQIPKSLLRVEGRLEYAGRSVAL